MPSQRIEVLRGVVLSWDDETYTARARFQDGRTVKFGSTAYQGLSRMDRPRVGVVIEGIFDKKTGDYIRMREIKP